MGQKDNNPEHPSTFKKKPFIPLIFIGIKKLICTIYKEKYLHINLLQFEIIITFFF